MVEGNNNENTYFKPNETIEYSEDFSTKKDSRYITFVVGDYSIKGEVHIGEHIIEFSRDKILSITDEIEVVDSSPGFEIALFIIAVSFGLMLFRKKNK